MQKGPATSRVFARTPRARDRNQPPAEVHSIYAQTQRASPFHFTLSESVRPVCLRPSSCCRQPTSMSHGHIVSGGLRRSSASQCFALAGASSGECRCNYAATCGQAPVSRRPQLFRVCPADGCLDRARSPRHHRASALVHPLRSRRRYVHHRAHKPSWLGLAWLACAFVPLAGVGSCLPSMRWLTDTVV